MWARDFRQNAAYYVRGAGYFLDTVWRGYSQVMFQDSPLVGFLFFIAVLWSASDAGLLQIAVGSLVGTAFATGCAYLLIHDDRSGVRHGLYSYNGCLVGIALPSLLVNSPILWGWVMFGSALSVLLMLGGMYVLRIAQAALFTAPFVLSTWIVLLASPFFGHLRHLHVALLPQSTGISYFLEATLHGVSQVFLCDNMIGGIVLLFALAVISWRDMLLAFLSAFMAFCIASLQGDNPQQIAEGLYAFSAVLTGLALGRKYSSCSWRFVFRVSSGILLTLLLQKIFNQVLRPIGLPVFTMPFVCTCWLFYMADRPDRSSS